MNEVMPLVSVLMTAYNRERFISEAIESVLASSYTNFELIIVDDGSSDETVAIARRYAAANDKIKVYVNEKNLGDYFNRNKAATYAQGKYLKYVDSDDIIYPESLSVFVRGMEMFPQAAVGIMSTIGQDEKPFPFVLQPREAYQYHFYKRGLFESGPTALIFRTESFRQMGGFSGKRYVGDSEINLSLAAKWPLVIVASSLVFWRQHEGQEIVKGQQTTGYLELQLPVFRHAFAQPDCPLDEKQKKSILAYYQKLAAREIVKIALVRKQPGIARKIYRQLSLSFGDIVNGLLFIKKKY